MTVSFDKIVHLVEARRENGWLRVDEAEHEHSPSSRCCRRLEAEVGFVHSSPSFCTTDARIHWRIKHTRLYPILPILTRLVSVLVSAMGKLRIIAGA